jgi:hypothetical protein
MHRSSSRTLARRRIRGLLLGTALLVLLPAQTLDADVRIQLDVVVEHAPLPCAIR